MATSLEISGLEGLAQFDHYLEAFPRYLRGQRGLSANTERVYLADLQSFRQYLANEKMGLTGMDRQTLRGARFRGRCGSFRGRSAGFDSV